MTHTPGPWKVIRLDGETYINPSRESGEYALLAKVHPPRGSAWPGGGRTTQKVEANAALIAAAPVMLAALKDVAEQIAAYDHLHGENSCAIDDAPALAAIRGLNPCYDPTSSIYPEVK